jgi:hypothetical protein
MKKAVFCLVLFLSLFVLFACATPQPTVTAPPPPAAPPPPPPQASQPTPPPQASQPTPPPAAPVRNSDLILTGADTYTVIRGDTLSNISRRKYQNGFYYPLIIMASPTAWTNLGLVQNQDLIEPGMALTIPKIQPNLDDPRARASMKRFFQEIADITDPKRPADAAGLRRLANQW